MSRPQRSVTVLGKRKTRDALVLHVSASDAASDSDYTPAASPVLATGTIAGPSKASALNDAEEHSIKARNSEKIYRCTYEGCQKAYTKPSKLEEHQRSHRGERPFVCSTCNKSYFRETHLQAHARSHLPKSERPIACTEPGCTKRFWTSQHLKAHENVIHKGEKPFKCTEARCDAAFTKHGQLRNHIAEIHAPPGTQPYRCEHEGCTKSFPTNQKLRQHVKVHDDKRYTCVQGTCMTATPLVYYPNWTALQNHIKTAHPPTCPHSSCNGKKFTTQGGLKSHLKLHEQREMEDVIIREQADNEADDEDDGERPRKKRRGGEIGREWKCQEEGCDKDFKSKKALQTHHAAIHEGRRDFVCDHEGCDKAFTYKHLLQRHQARLHGVDNWSEDEADAEMDIDEHSSPSKTKKKGRSKGMKRTEIEATTDGIDGITGLAYTNATSAVASTSDWQPLRPLLLPCPHPDLTPFDIQLTETLETVSAKRAAEIAAGQIECEYVFGRAYDLRRHLRAVHGVEVEKDVVDRWAILVRTGRWVKGGGTGKGKEQENIVP